MRDYLFRGKRRDNGEWVYWNIYGEFCTSKGRRIRLTRKTPYGEKYYYYIYEIKKLIDPETVGQYTGLPDKNGIKIFEGDIIRYADLYDYNCYLESIDNLEVYDNIDLGNIWTIDEVVYGIKVGYPAFDLNKCDFEINGLSELSESGQYYYEVIGNIHDNPELLKGGDKNE